MKNLYLFELTLLMIADAILLLSLGYKESGDFVVPCIVLSDLILGPIQFITAIGLLFNKNRLGTPFKIYLIVALLSIIAAITLIAMLNNLNIDDQIIMNIFIMVLFFSFLLAHYFVYVLYKMQKESTTNQISQS